MFENNNYSNENVNEQNNSQTVQSGSDAAHTEHNNGQTGWRRPLAVRTVPAIPEAIQEAAIQEVIREAAIRAAIPG